MKRTEMDQASIMTQSVVPQTLASALSIEDYVRRCLLQTSVNQVLTLPEVSVATLRNLRIAGIRTAFDLDGHSPVSDIPPQQWQVITGWCSGLKIRFSIEYRSRAAL